MDNPVYRRPKSLDHLVAATHFSRAEIKRLYRDFKAECPTGLIKEETFRTMYTQFFPKGGNEDFAPVPGVVFISGPISDLLTDSSAISWAARGFRIALTRLCFFVSSQRESIFALRVQFARPR